MIVLAFAFIVPVAPFVQMVSAQTTLYVATNGTGGGTSWADATNSIQGAIVAISSSNPTNTVWVSNGVYEIGGVTNFPTGRTLTNRVAIYKAITVRSANNDPANTVIKGYWDPATNGPAAVRCVYMTNGSALIGFTLTNGATLTESTDNGRGGGVYCQSTNTVISNCVLAGNSAWNYSGGSWYGTLFNCMLIGNKSYAFGGGAAGSTLFNCILTSNSVVGTGYGGGAAYGTMYNCTLTGNSALGMGGGAAWCTLYNCTIVGNSAAYGGGVMITPSYGALYNCTIVGNSASVQGGGVYGTMATQYNCTIVGNSAPVNGGSGVYQASLYNCISFSNNLGNRDTTYYYSTTADPMFITNGSGFGTNHVAGNYRLRKYSPAINAGTNFAYMSDPTDVRSKDLDGYRRIDNFSRQVDMGAYEYLPSGTMFIMH